MKIGVNSRIYQNKNTGIPYYIQCLYSKLLEIDKENSYIFFQTELNKTLGDTLVQPVPSGYLGSLLFDLWYVHRLAHVNKVDIIHGPAHFLPFFKERHQKCIVTIHDLSLVRFPELTTWQFRAVFKYITGRSLRNATIVVTDSHSTKRDVVELYGIDEAKVRVVHLGLNEVFLKESMPRRLVDKPYFFSLTTHPQRKNILRVLEVFGEHLDDFGDLIYVVAGIISDDQLQVIKDQIAKYHLEDRVLLYGYASEDQLISLYKYARFFIYPSFYEGFGFPIVEAMASGCPVITSNTSSMPELMPDDTWLVDPYSKESIFNCTQSMLNLNTAERTQLIAKNKSFAQQFNWNKSAAQMIEIFQGL